MQARPEELEYKNWWIVVACKWPRKMEIYCTQKIDGKRTTILEETEENEKQNEFLFICCLLYLLYHCVWNISLSFILIYVHFTHSRPRLIAGLLLLLLWKSKIPIMLFSIQTFRGLISPILLQHIQNKNTFIQPTILFCFEYFHNFRNY